MRDRSSLGALPTVSLLAALALVAGACSGATPRPGSAEGATAAIRNAAPGVAYVGIDECRQCHLGVWTTFKRTGMGRSFHPLTPDRAVEDWSGTTVLVHEPSGVAYRMLERDGRYYQRQFIPGADGRERFASERELVWVVGSGNHNRTYVVEEDGKLFQAPVCWYPEASRWEMCPGFEHRNDGFAREVSDSCMFCHNGVMRLEPGQRNRFEEPLPHGIGCERCHGPGELHVARWSHGSDLAAEERDDTIVHPRHLPREARLAVCAQCHLGDARATERVNRHGRDLRAFRPGRPLEDAVVAFRFTEPTRFDFGLSAQVDRMLLSRCYTASEGRLDCLTCHNPHVSVYDADRPPDLFRRRCLGCHDLEACGAPAERRAATSPADDCVACHMRRAEPDDLRFSRFTDHWIRTEIDEPRDHRESLEIEPVFPDAFARLPEAEQAYHRARADFLLASEAGPRDREALFARAESGLRDAIARGFDAADAWFFLGKSSLALRKPQEAERAFAEAVRRDPAHADAAFALGQAVAARGDVEGGIAIYEGMLERDPSSAMAHAELGRLEAQRQRIAPALESFTRALELEPWNASVRTNYAKLFVASGRLEEAVRQAEEAAARSPASPEVWDFYANVMAAAGREAEARLGRERLRKLATAAGAPDRHGMM